MVDSGATATFIHRKFVEKNSVRTRKLRNPIPLFNIDGTQNREGSITDVAVLDLVIGSHSERMVLVVTDIGPEDLIIGIDWLRRHNPEIDWTEGSLKLSRCPENCGTSETSSATISPTPKSDTGDRPTAPRRKRKTRRVRFKREPVILEELPDLHDDYDEEYDPDNEDDMLEAWSRGVKVDNAPKLFALAGFTYSQALAEEENAKKPERTFEEMVPEQYREFAKVFSKAASERLPERKPYDHAIELVPNYQAFHSRVYPLSPNEQVALDEFLEEQKKKGYIRESKSPMSSPFFFVKKKDGTLRPVQDYRRLNEITVKNRYPLPIISQLIDALKNAKFFTKLDIRWGYNNVRIKEGDEWKAAFVTNRGLWEPLVMFFGLTGSPSTFQAMMNEIFKDLIVKGKVAIYLDDILIYTNDLEEHRAIVKEVLRRLEEHDLFLKPEKCEFEKPEVEYLGLIISHNCVKMDPVKVKAIKEWPVPKNVKEVQQFRGFANFYRRFIEGFSKITKPLDRLTRKDVQWEWGPAEQEAFDTLKEKFASYPVLAIYNPEKETRIEVDASGFAVGAILSQKQDDGKWHPIAYLSESMSEAERNYEIYDREMLSIIRGLVQWRHYLEGLPEKFEIITDHKNLEYWKDPQNLSRRQARWARYLTRFDFFLTHRPGKQHGAPDGLSRRADHFVSDSHDNQDVTVLTPEHFRAAASKRGHAAVVQDKALLRRIRECSDKDREVAEALEKVQNLGPPRLQKGLEEWNSEQGLLLYRGKVYVPKNAELRRDIVKIHHDSLAVGHPGRYKTLELVSRNYWWPGMSKFIHEYVDTCDACNRTKTFPAKPQGPLKPNEVPEGPWQIVTSDFIVGLPESKGCNSIMVSCDRYGKGVHLSGTRDTVDAEGATDIYIRDVWRLHGTPKVLISDRGPQFASKFLRGIHKAVGTKPALSTAYHPQTDGQTERWNQEIEQYLRVFCNHHQDNWFDLLPFLEFALNQRVHEATGFTPFYLTYGYTPEWTVHANPMSNVPGLKDRLQALKEAREDTRAKLELTAEQMKRFYDRHVREAPEFKVGDKVWLDAKNLHTDRPNQKLSDRRLGPYPVIEKVGDLNYKLKLPRRVHVHPVFHVSLLYPHKESQIPGRKQPEPPPVTVNGQEEYEVEEILDSRMFRRKLEYKVRWKGFDKSYETWEPAENVEHAKKLVEDFHRRRPSAPRMVAAAAFKDLQALFRPMPEALTIAPKPTEWALGKARVGTSP